MADFHEIQNFLLRVSMDEQHVLEVVTNLPLKLEVSKKKGKVLNISSNYGISLIITTKQQLDLGG